MQTSCNVCGYPFALHHVTSVSRSPRDLLVNPPSDPLREYTTQARAAITAAYAYARELGHPTVAPEHLLLGLIGAGDGVATRVLAALEVSLDALRLRIEELLGGRESAPDPDVTMSIEGRRVIDLAWDEA